MKKYGVQEEQAIRTELLVREWSRSKLLNPLQQKAIQETLKIDVRRTNGLLRLILFVFSLLIIVASLLFVGSTLEIRDRTTMALFYGLAGSLCFFLADRLIGGWRLYRHGIEEAAACCSVILLAVAADSFVHLAKADYSSRTPLLAGLLVGAVFSFAIYFRFGYVYGVVAGLVCLAFAPFQLGLEPSTARVLAFGEMLVVFGAARSLRLAYSDEFPGDDYGAIQAAAWAGGYLVLHLRLSPQLLQTAFPRLVISEGPFYWFTFVMIWILPAFGLYLALKDKDRWLLDVSIAMSVVTLVTNKPYLGGSRQTWDPILLGLLLIGVVVAVRRWISESGERYGFTTERLRSSDKGRLSMLATASAVAHTGHVAVAKDDSFTPGGGRSGGAGASGSF
jgi:hypothetical protein